jgi:arginase
MDLGAARRGVDMGPSSVRLAALNERVAALGYEVEDLGNVKVAQRETVRAGSERAKYLSEIAATCAVLTDQTASILQAGRMPLVLGGDHSIAVGTVAGVASVFRQRNERIGLIWIDAHADMNTPETTPSGNVHGMPLACCLGQGPPEMAGIGGFTGKVKAENVAIVGLRAVDQRERQMVRDAGVCALTMRDIDERGLRAVMRDALAAACDGTAGFHLSLDMDAVDPREAPGVGTPVRGGLTYREAHLAMELICDSNQMVSMELVEINPVLDEANRTAVLGVELVLSALGQRIL